MLRLRNEGRCALLMAALSMTTQNWRGRLLLGVTVKNGLDARSPSLRLGSRDGRMRPSLHLARLRLCWTAEAAVPTCVD